MNNEKKEECKITRCPCHTVYAANMAQCPNCSTPNPAICVGCGDGKK